VITTVFTDPHSDIADKFNDQITALIVIAASLEHTANHAPTHPDADRRTC